MDESDRGSEGSSQSGSHYLNSQQGDERDKASKQQVPLKKRIKDVRLDRGQVRNTVGNIEKRWNRYVRPSEGACAFRHLALSAA